MHHSIILLTAVSCCACSAPPVTSPINVN